jgi:hypothetical protein
MNGLTLMQNLMSFFIVAVALSLVLKGDRLYRCIAFAFLWQFLTPLRHPAIDIPMFAATFAATEYVYLKVKGYK